MCVANSQMYTNNSNSSSGSSSNNNSNNTNNNNTFEQRVLFTMHSWFSFEFIRHQPSSKPRVCMFASVCILKRSRYFSFPSPIHIFSRLSLCVVVALFFSTFPRNLEAFRSFFSVLYIWVHLVHCMRWRRRFVLVSYLRILQVKCFSVFSQQKKIVFCVARSV